MTPVHGMKWTADGRLERAAAWHTRLREDPEMEVSDLCRWQEFIADPENRLAFEAIERVAGASSTLGRPPMPNAKELLDDTYDGTVPIRAWRARAAGRRDPSRNLRTKVWRAAAWAASAALLSVGLFVVLRYVQWPTSRIAPLETYQTRGGEHRQVVLADGSKIELGAKTSIAVQYGAARRSILLNGGEALFTVAHDRSRPFVVYAGGRSVTALGTQFNVWRDLDRTTVTVTDGTVDVGPVRTPPRAEAPDSFAERASPGRSARLAKGQELTYTEAGEMSRAVQAADLSAAVAWREGRRVYRQMPLKYVIADVNRYFKQQIVLSDRAASELKFSGAVLQTQPASEFLKALQNIFELEVIDASEEQIVIRSRAPASAEPAARKLISAALNR